MTITEISAGDCASLRYPDPAIEILDPSFLPYRLFNASVECLGSGLRWAEGPVWFGDGRYLLCSDIPNNRIVRWDETTGGLSVFRQPSNHSNGLTRDRQGRLIACEHLTRRVTRTEYDGSITVLADGFDGKRLNSPNDAVCKSDGSIWFSDPAFGISGDWEGDKAEAELPQAVYRVDGQSGNLTRVIAGPVATRFLAGFGAEVLRVDPSDWHEPALEPEVLLGKRCTRLELRDDRDRRTFERLLSGADVLVHGYRRRGLDGLGLDADARQRIRPGLIDVSLDAYGHSGPWADRRGFDSLVQFATGIAAAGMERTSSSTPVSLPVQALDHATGYLVAAEVVGAIRRAADDGRTERARLSLARTARLLVDHRGTPAVEPLRPVDDADVAVAVERTPWGPARRLWPPVRLGSAEMAWPSPATTLGSSAPEWSA